MIVVSNSSPIMNLEQLYGKVLIPEAVLQELSTVGSKQLGVTAIQTLSWIETRSVANRSLVNMLLLELDVGETEAIALAIEVNADLLLIDERRGRKVASRLGLKFIGLLGMLIEANVIFLSTSATTIFTIISFISDYIQFSLLGLGPES